MYDPFDLNSTYQKAFGVLFIYHIRVLQDWYMIGQDAAIPFVLI